MRIEVTEDPGSGVRILNQPGPPAFRESVKVAEQNLHTNAASLIGDRNARAHEYTIQLRPFDADTPGTRLGVPVLAAFVGTLLDGGTRGAAIIAGPLNLGGSLDQLADPVAIAELAVDKGASVLLVPVTARKELMNLPDDIWTKLNIEFYSEAADGVFKLLE